MNLQSIEQEAAACRAAWKAKPRAKYGAHIHHEAPFEALAEPIEGRIAYILARKPEGKQALRLRLMRPITAAAWAEYEKATITTDAEYEKVKAAAWAERAKAKAAARAEYAKVAAPAWAEREKAKAAAWAEYRKAVAAARAEYAKAKAAADAEYRKAKAPARAEYRKAEAAAHRRYCPTPDCPWDGESIF